MTPLWASIRVFVRALRSVLPADMLLFFIWSERYRVLSMMIAWEVCVHCGRRKVKS
jgi:uncharacterized membrane protein